MGIGGPKRPYDMKERARWWKIYVAAHGFPLVEIWASGLQWQEACELEKTIIAHHKRKVDGGSLVNMSLGGDGTPGVIPSDETRKKISEASKRNYPRVAERLVSSVRGRTMTQEQRAKISAAHRGRVFSSQHRANISAARTGLKMSEASRMKMRAQRKGSLNAMYGKKRPEVGLRNAELKRKPVVQFDAQGVLIQRFNSLADMQDKTGFDRSAVLRVCKGKQKTSYGYIWQYA